MKVLIRENFIWQCYKNLKTMYPVIDDSFLEGRPLSYSSLKEFRKSPKHYLEYLTKPRITTDAMLLGSITEVLLLYSKAEFEAQYVVYTLENSLRSNAGKAEMDALQTAARANNKVLVTKETYDLAVMISEGLKAYPDLKPFLDNIVRKRLRLSWKDKSTDLPIIGYTDWDAKIGGQLFICDLKVTKDAEPEAFMRSAYNYDYTIQVGSYLEGYKNTRYQFPEFVYVAAESVPPYNVSILVADNDFKEYARNEFLGTLKAFRYCMNNNLFGSGYEFRLMGLMPYFGLTKPNWGKVRFGDYYDGSEG